MGGVIVPKTLVEPVEGPLIFLAGPIRGAPNWQNEAIQRILQKNGNATITSPRREVRESISKYVLSGNDAYFTRQRAWERYYLEIAAKKGAILFWLPGETEHSCEKAYGAMTRIELGQWMTRYKSDHSIRICVGSDGKFSELDTIKYDLSLDCPDMPIKNTLEETCLEALRLTHLK
jgi:hypothetical protein